MRLNPNIYVYEAEPDKLKHALRARAPKNALCWAVLPKAVNTSDNQAQLEETPSAPLACVLPLTFFRIQGKKSLTWESVYTVRSQSSWGFP